MQDSTARGKGPGIRAARLAVAALDGEGEIGVLWLDVAGGAVGRQPCHGEVYKFIIFVQSARTHESTVHYSPPPPPPPPPPLPIPNHLRHLPFPSSLPSDPIAFSCCHL